MTAIRGKITMQRKSGIDFFLPSSLLSAVSSSKNVQSFSPLILCRKHRNQWRLAIRLAINTSHVQKTPAGGRGTSDDFVSHQKSHVSKHQFFKGTDAWTAMSPQPCRSSCRERRQIRQQTPNVKLKLKPWLPLNSPNLNCIQTFG